MNQRRVRQMPDEVLLVSTWFSAKTAFTSVDIVAVDVACQKMAVLSAEVKRRGLQAAMLPTGRLLRER